MIGYTYIFFIKFNFFKYQTLKNFNSLLHKGIILPCNMTGNIHDEKLLKRSPYTRLWGLELPRAFSYPIEYQDNAKLA